MTNTTKTHPSRQCPAVLPAHLLLGPGRGDRLVFKSGGEWCGVAQVVTGCSSCRHGPCGIGQQTPCMWPAAIDLVLDSSWPPSVEMVGRGCFQLLGQGCALTVLPQSRLSLSPYVKPCLGIQSLSRSAGLVGPLYYAEIMLVGAGEQQGATTPDISVPENKYGTKLWGLPRW